MLHAYVRDGAILTTSRPAILAAMVEDGRDHYDAGWFSRTGTAEKKAVGVYEVIDRKPHTVPKFVMTQPLGPAFDPQTDTVTRDHAMLEMEVGTARALLKQEVTNYHRDRILTGHADLAGNSLSTHNDAYNELEKAVSRAAETPFAAVTRAGDRITFDLATAQAALGAVRAYRNACVDREAALYALADEANSVSELRAIDIHSGWP